MLSIDQLKKIFSPGEKVVAAVSGGMDSMALAHLLAQARTELGISLHLAHVNHNLRGQESNEDALFVNTFAGNRSIPCTVLSVEPVKAGGTSLQDSARTLRYDALCSLCRSLGAGKLAVAHHRSDQAETLLINLLRGSGPRGLAGMKSVRPLAEGILMVRPLLTTSREAIRDYCDKMKLPWRDDSSNDKDYYRRNHIRRHLLPLLREYNPEVERVLANTASILREDLELLDDLALPYIEAAIVASPLPFAPKALSIASLKAMPLALRRRAVISLAGSNSLEARHVDQFLALIHGETGAELSLLGGVRAYRLPDSIALGGECLPSGSMEVAITMPGEADFRGRKVYLAQEPIPGGCPVWLPLSRPLAVTNRRPGDRLRMTGGTKKLKDVLIDFKVPRWLRDELAVLRAGEDLVWVEGIGISAEYSRPGANRQQAFVKIT